MIEDVDRRAFLVKLLGIPAALMALENDLLSSGNKIILVFNDDPMSFLEDIVATRWKIHLYGNKNIMKLSPQGIQGFGQYAV